MMKREVPLHTLMACPNSPFTSHITSKAYWMLNIIVISKGKQSTCQNESDRQNSPNHNTLLRDQTSQNLACKKHPFLLALRRWGHFTRKNVCDLVTEIPYWWRKICPESGQKELIGRRSSYIVLAIVYEWQTKDKRPQRSNVNAKNL